jgi:hypothetical protein
MTSTQLRPKDGERPLVAVWCSVPLLGEAVEFALEFAEVRSFASSGGDLAGLLRWLHPDAVVVDSEEGAEDAAPFAREHDTPLLHLSVRDRSLRVYRAGVWDELGNGDGLTPEAIRNVVAGALFARGGPVR